MPPSLPSTLQMSLARLLLSLALLFPLLAQAVIVDAPTGQVNALAKGADGTLYAGGSFLAAGANTGHGAALDAATGLVNRNFPQVLRTDLTGGLVSAAVPDAAGGWYIGGVFNSVGGLPRNNLAHIDSSGAVTAWNPSTTGGASNGGIATMVMSGSTLYIGGEFTQVNGVDRSMLAAIGTDGTLLSWNPGVSGAGSAYPRALAVDNGIIYAGGGFTSVCTTAASTCWNGSAAQTRNRLAAFGAVDGSLQSWNPNASSTVSAVISAPWAVPPGVPLPQQPATSWRRWASMAVCKHGIPAPTVWSMPWRWITASSMPAAASSTSARPPPTPAGTAAWRRPATIWRRLARTAALTHL